MPIEIKDSDNGLGVVITGRGIVTEDEYLELFKEHLAQAGDQFKKYRYSLNDWTEVSAVEVTSDAIAQIAELCKQAAKINPDPVVAHVAARDITFGLARMWENLAYETKWEIMIFRQREDAEEWIRQIVKEKYGIIGLTFG